MRRILILLLLAPLFIHAQREVRSSGSDSLEREKAKNKRIYARPRRASIMSAVIPGLGQVYNRKYWKVPVIYAGLGAFGWIFKQNNDQYQFYRRNLRAVYDDDPNTKNETHYSPDQLQSQKVYYKRYRDLAAIGMGAIYLLNIIDANVDAHLRTFDVSDDLSLRAGPWFVPGVATGVRLTLQFK